MSNYSAVKINLPIPRPVENSDNLLVFDISGNPVVTSREYSAGEPCYFVPAGAKLNPKIIHELNMYRHSEKNKDTTKTGYIDDSGRVKAVKLRGQYSLGLLIKVSSIEHLNIALEDISKKYVPQRGTPGAPGSRKEQVPLERQSRVLPGQFAFHEDTNALWKFTSLRFSEPKPFWVTEKLHGASAIYGKLLFKQPLSWLARLAKFLGVPVKESDYEFIYASRRSIKNDGLPKKHFYKNDIWALVAAQYNLAEIIPPGITLYGEIVGPGIQGRNGEYYDYQKLARPEDADKDYLFFVYRITYTDINNNVIEFTHEQVIATTRALGLKTPPALEVGVTDNLKDLYEYLQNAEFFGGPDPYCSSPHLPREGVIVRFGVTPDWHVYKMKSPDFLLYETKQVDAGTPDIEEAESVSSDDSSDEQASS